MALKDFRTRRSLLTELESRIEKIDSCNRTIEKLTDTCDTLNSDLKMWKKISETYKQIIDELTIDNEELRKELKALEALEAEAFNFECVEVKNA